MGNKLVKRLGWSNVHTIYLYIQWTGNSRINKMTKILIFETEASFIKKCFQKRSQYHYETTKRKRKP